MYRVSINSKVANTTEMIFNGNTEMLIWISMSYPFTIQKNLKEFITPTIDSKESLYNYNDLTSLNSTQIP